MVCTKAAYQFDVVPGANVRYVVPNSCAPGAPNVLFLRPMVVRNNVRLEVTMDGRTVRSRGLAHVQPSEMIRLSLDRDEIAVTDGAPSHQLEVSIR